MLDTEVSKVCLNRDPAGIWDIKLYYLRYNFIVNNIINIGLSQQKYNCWHIGMIVCIKEIQLIMDIIDNLKYNKY